VLVVEVVVVEVEILHAVVLQLLVHRR
jgi:hypothetical protein